MDGSTAIYNILITDVDVLAIVSVVDEEPAIVDDPTEQENWSSTDTTITIYPSIPVDKSRPVLEASHTVNCRGADLATVRNLSDAVVKALDRININGDEGRLYCQRMFVIKPANSADSYNLPVETRVVGIKELE